MSDLKHGITGKYVKDDNPPANGEIVWIDDLRSDPRVKPLYRANQRWSVDDLLDTVKKAAARCEKAETELAAAAADALRNGAAKPAVAEIASRDALWVDKVAAHFNGANPAL